MVVKEGDIFTIPIDEKRVGIGQVILKEKGPGPLYLVVFKPQYDVDAAAFPENVIDLEMIFSASSMSALIKNGHWRVVGNRAPDMSKIALPYFKTGRENSYYLEDFFGKRIRKAAAEEIDFFDNPFSVAPIRIEKALKAYHGLLPWSPDYDKLTITYAVAHSRLDGNHNNCKRTSNAIAEGGDGAGREN